MESDTQFDDVHDDFKQMKRPGVIVLASGVVTTVLSIIAIYALSMAFENFYAMGFYLWFVIPVGAIIVGLVAGSGYGIASRVTGAKIGKGLMFQILAIQVVAFFMMNYVEYTMREQDKAAARKALDQLAADQGKQIPADLQEQLAPSTFWQDFDQGAREFHWVEDGKPGKPFGVWGYAMRALELAGFALGSLIAPALLFSVPYCDACQLYMKTKDLGLLPAGVVPRKVKKKDTEAMAAYEQEIEAALNEGQEMVATMLKAVEENKPDDFTRVLAEHKDNKKEIDKLTSRIQVQLQHCRQCQGGSAVFKLHTGHGEDVNTVELGKAELDPSFVRSLETLA